MGSQPHLARSDLGLGKYHKVPLFKALQAPHYHHLAVQLQGNGNGQRQSAAH
jgi:hypothetical protein